MEKKRINIFSIFEWIFIGLFLAIVVSFASIQVYRAVINSDWFIEIQDKKNFTQTAEEVNTPSNIKYIRAENEADEYLIYDVPTELFDDLAITNYERVDDVEKRREIFRQNCITVFLNDNTSASFFITDDGKLYWETYLRCECNSLLEWYNNGEYKQAYE